MTVESRQAGLSEPPGRPISLRIGEHRIELARDDDVRVNRFDPAPAILAAGALIALAPTQSVNEDVPLAWLAPFSAGFGLTAWWAHREIERRGAEASWEIVRASLVLCTTTSIVSTVMQRNPFMPSGEPNQPVVAEILPAIYLLRIHWRNLTPDQRRVAGSTLVGIVAACLALMPRPFRWTKVAVDLSWLVTNWVGVAGLGDALDTEAARLTEILSVGDEDAIDNAWQRGRRFVVELVEAAAADGRRLFVEREVSLPRETRQLIRRRLAQIDGRIAALKADAPT